MLKIVAYTVAPMVMTLLAWTYLEPQPRWVQEKHGDSNA